MKWHKPLKAFTILGIISINIGCDQLSKNIVRNRIAADASFHFLHDHLMLMRVENKGAFLSLGNQIPPLLRIFALSLLPTLLLGAALWYMIRTTTLTKLSITGICFIVGGGAGNLFDRVVHGSVTDFMYINFSFFHTGVFNAADLSITTGVIMMLTDAYFGKRSHRQHLLS